MRLNDPFPAKLAPSESSPKSASNCPETELKPPVSSTVKVSFAATGASSKTFTAIVAVV